MVSKLKLKLDIELVPSKAWWNNLRNLYSPAVWDKLKRDCYKAFNYKCKICDAKGKLNCHEIWAYDDKRHVQQLVGCVALCDMCHYIKHLGFAEILARQGKLDYDKLIEHFMKVNNCSKEEFEKYRKQAFDRWKERSKYKWKLCIDTPYWHYAIRYKGTYPKPTNRNGKWLIFINKENADEIWTKIKKAVEEGKLGNKAKASAGILEKIDSKINKGVICIYTYDWKDEKDVMKTREELRKLGVTNKISYKTDEDTLKGKYRATGYTNISKYYE